MHVFDAKCQYDTQPGESHRVDFKLCVSNWVLERGKKKQTKNTSVLKTTASNEKLLKHMGKYIVSMEDLL